MSSSVKYPSTEVATARSRRGVADAQFAGRLGGNQEFIADVEDEDVQSLLKKQPDAAPLTNVSQSFDLRGFLVPSLWTMAFLEGWGTFLLVFGLGAVATGLTTVDASPIASAWTAVLANFIGLSVFTFSLGPVSGAHLNPTITLTTFFIGLTTLPRAILYIVAQVIGAVVAGYWLRLGLGDEWYFPKGVIPGCTVDPDTVSPGQLFALEFVFCQVLIFLAIGLGLDPRQGRVYGPAFGPILVGVSLGFGTLISAFAKPGYTGMSANPARCLGLMAAKNDLRYHYVHWLGPLAASMLNGVFYFIIPPWQREEKLSVGMIRKVFTKPHTV